MIIYFKANSSAQWYQWSSAQPHTRLCAECWSYYKKLGGLKYPKKSGKSLVLYIFLIPFFDRFLGPDRRQGRFNQQKINFYWNIHFRTRSKCQ
jgi:hypothetical protein